MRRREAGDDLKELDVENKCKGPTERGTEDKCMKKESKN